MTSRVEIIVRGYHLDVFGHVNNARYLEFLEEGRWDFYDDLFSANYFTHRNLGFVVVNININYRRAVTLGRTIFVETGVKEAGGRSVTLIQKILFKQSGEIAADAHVKFVIVDNKTGRAVPMEGELKRMLSKEQ